MVTSHLQLSTLLVFAMPLTQSLDPSLLPRVFAPTLLDLLDLWSPCETVWGQLTSRQLPPQTTLRAIPKPGQAHTGHRAKPQKSQKQHHPVSFSGIIG